MVKKPFASAKYKARARAKAKGPPARAGDSAVAEPSKVNAPSPGSVKAPMLKRRKLVKVRVRRVKTAGAAAASEEVASVGADTAVGDALASASMPHTIASAEASPVAQAPKPATDAEGSVPAQMPANAEASASAAKQNLAGTDGDAAAGTDADAAAASSKGKGVSADNSGGDTKGKKRKEMVKERVMNDKGKAIVGDGGRNGKGININPVAKKEGRGEKVAGFIFMCNQKTKQECYQSRLFGLPSGKIERVKKIRPGAKLFLYDFDLKLLYGLYTAASNGGLNLVQEAFGGKFPAQVKFKIHKDCLPLRETSFKHAIKENYRERSKFDPELSSKQVQRLIALFKPANVPQSVPNNRLDERRQNREHRQPYHIEERRRPLPIEERRRQPMLDEQRRPAVKHVAVEDPYRAPRFDPLTDESRPGHSLVNVQDENYIYYKPVHVAPEPRHIPLALDSRHAPPVIERNHVDSVLEPRYVPPAYYRTSAPSYDSYYQSVANLGPERFADRTVAERAARDPIITRDHTTHTERMEELYRTGGPRDAHVEELYRPKEFAFHADYGGISTRADRLEELYRSDQFDTHAVHLPRQSTCITSAYETRPAYAEPSRRPYSTRANASGGPVSSLYTFSGGPVYR